jgi:hypothetical protein
MVLVGAEMRVKEMRGGPVVQSTLAVAKSEWREKVVGAGEEGVLFLSGCVPF